MAFESMHRQVLLLAGAQALGQIASIIVMMIGGLAGAQLAEDARWATLPVATMLLGTAVMTFPASFWMGRVGRRAGFLGGVLFGIAGGLVAALAIAQRSLELLAFGTFLVGNQQAFVQYYRFAASEVADERFRPRAISFVMTGGVVAAVAGPLLAQLGGPLFSFEYLGSFLIVSVVSLIGAGVLLGLHVPVRAAGPGARSCCNPPISWRCSLRRRAPA
jgi:MFS family permease